MYTQLIPFKTIWANFIILYPIDSFQYHITSFCIVYPTDSFQDHLPQFYHCVLHWLLSRPFDPILSFFNHLTPFKTIWPKLHWKVLHFSLTALITEKCCAFHWKATKTSNSTPISHYNLAFYSVQREGQLGICYILVVFGGACMFKWCMYTHILTWFCCFHEKWCFLCENWYFLWKGHKKHWKVKSTWKLKSIPEMWEAPKKWKAHEKHMKIEKHMKSIPEKWKHLKS